MASMFYRGTPGAVAILAAAGGLIGYLSLALLIRLLDESGIQVFSQTLILSIWVLLTTSAISLGMAVWRQAALADICSNSFIGTRVDVVVESKLMMPCIAVVALLAMQTIFQVVVTPVAGWDALGLWTTWAEFFLQFDHGVEGYLGKTRAEFGSFPEHHPRHPPTVYHLSAFSGFALENTNMLRGWLVPWTCIWGCGASAVWGFARGCCRSRWIPLLALWGYFSLPLLTNHAILVGYADFWIAILMTVAAAALATAIVGGGKSFWGVGLLCAVAPVGIKGTGLIYSLVLLLPLTAIFAFRLSSRSTTFVFLIMCVAALWLWVSGFDIQIAGQRFALVRGEEEQILAGGYVMAMDSYPTISILRNEFWALFMNQSFSLLFLLFVVSAAIGILNHSVQCTHARALIFLLLVAVALVVAFSVPQLIREYAENFAEPRSDTGGSRFILALGPILIMATVLAARIMEFSSSSRESKTMAITTRKESSSQ